MNVPRYSSIIREGLFELITVEQLTKALDRIPRTTARNRSARCLIIALYYLGARPNEVLRLVPNDFSKEGSYFIIKVPGSKGGYRRPLMFTSKHEHLRELYDYATKAIALPDQLLFWQYVSTYIRVRSVRGKDKMYKEISNKLRYYFARWFKGIIPKEQLTPYILRHNCFSRMASKGASLEQIRQAKGGRTMSSVMPYVHMIKADAKKIGKYMQ